MSFKHTFEYNIFEEQIEITKDFLQKIKKYSLTKDTMNSHNFLKKDKSLLRLVNKKIKTFLDKPIGVAEHIDYVETAEKKLDKLAHAEDKLSSLKNL